MDEIFLMMPILSLQGAGEIFNHLVDYIAYPPERVASAYELIGNHKNACIECKNHLSFLMLLVF